MQKSVNKYKMFLKSALTEENPFIDTAGVINWLKKRNDAISVNIERVDFSDMALWFFDKKKSNLIHRSGKFFSIDGIQVTTNFGAIKEWEQPIINQPEIGYLGFITKEINGILYFLVQAKIEPGNVNNIQLSPTLQATKSNYTCVHKGKIPAYLEFFRDRKRCEVLLDQLQSEQGARFLRKRNRNIIIKTEENIELGKDFIWLTLGQIKKLIRYNNLVNMDTRTVISGIPFGDIYETKIMNSAHIDDLFSKNMMFSALNIGQGLYSFDDIIAWFTKLKARYELNINPIKLSDVNSWVIEKDQIRHIENKFFKIIAANIEISNREVGSWMQPLVQPAQEGLIAFIVKKINGIYHFIVQAKVECGNFDVIEMAPTVQCLTGNYKETKTGSLPFLDYVLNAKSNQIMIDTMQSEEGGRFYKEQNRNIIIKADDNFDLALPSNYCWMTLNQLLAFLKFNNYLNIQARSLISAISFI